MNYNSIQEILSAGTTNMTVLRNGSKQDDDTDKIDGVSWFTFNDTVASAIYASGNSFIGFGSSSEHLKVNRRDCALYYLYREEGMLYDCYKFLKIRWSGYSSYSNTAEEYKLEYDIILWETGDISLHMVSIPTSQNDGSYEFAGSSIHASSISISNPNVTFKKTSNGYIVSNDIINLTEPAYYLVRSGSSYYTVVNGILSNINVTNLTADVFLNNGVINTISLALLDGLTNPELICWYKDGGKQPTNGFVANGIPSLPQFVQFQSHDMVGRNGIKKVESLASEDVIYSISIDNGQTWKYYDNGVWKNVVIDLDGMPVDTLQSIDVEKWAELVTSTVQSYKFRCVLPSRTSYVEKIYVKYI